MRLPKKIAALLIITLVASNVGTLTFADTIQRVSSENLIGKERWETAIEVSKKGWTSSDEAIIVNDSAIADALSVTPFAEAKNAPILLTQKDKLDERTKAELKRLGVKKVYIIGGEDVLTKTVEAELKAQNIQIDRIQGDTRELTALEIAKRLDKIKHISEIAVVNGTTGLSDAVSIAAVAADKDMAIILSNPNEGTKACDEFIKSKNVTTSYVIGGKNAISNDVEKKLPNAKRIEGVDRNETNAKVIETFYTEKEIKNAYVAKDGMGKEDYLIDALSVGVLAAKNDSPVIIVGNKLNQMQKDVTNTKSFDTVTQVGGNGNETAFDELKTMQGVTVYEVKTVTELNNALAKADANDVINVRSLTDNTESNDVIEIKSNNAVTVNLYDNSKSFVSDMTNGKLVVNTELSSIDVKSGDLVINSTVETVNVVGTANVTVSKTATVNKVEVRKNATGTVIENAGKIENIVSNAPNVSVENNGIVGSISGTNNPSVDGNPVKPPSTGNPSVGGNPVKPPSTGDDSIEEKLFDVDSSFTKSTISIGITPSKDLDESGNVIKTKDKTWSGYLNDDQKNKYGNGIEKPGTYLNELKAGVRYTTTVNSPSVGSNVLDRFEDVAKVKVVVKVGDLTQEVILDNTAYEKPEEPEEKLFDVDASFTKSTISIGITPSKDMNIGLLTKDNIKISYLDESCNVIKTKDKTWSGYLNDEQKNKYGNGAEKPGTYSNELKAGVRYTTTVNAPGVGSNVLNRFEDVAQVKVVVKVANLTQEIVLDNNAK